MNQKLLEVKKLEIGFGDHQILGGISFTLERGEIVGLVGDSGSGKSILSRSILGLEQNVNFGFNSSIKFQSDKLGEIEMTNTANPIINNIRGVEVSMIFQEPKVALNPAYSCGFQLREVVEKHLGLSGQQSVAKSLELFEQVGLSDWIYNSYPFQVSGGEAQRVMIAMATVAKPKLLLADEPTTSLDPVNEMTIIRNLQQINEETGMTVLLVSHNEELLSKVTHRILYLENGQLTKKKKSLVDPKKLIVKKSDAPQSTVLAVKSLTLDKIGDRKLSCPILNNVSFELLEGETLGVVGNSGSGKSTLSRCILKLLSGYSGTIEFNGHEISGLDEQGLNQFRRNVQIIFQDPLDSLNPRIKIEDALMEVLYVHKIGEDRSQRNHFIERILEKVHLSTEKLKLYPYQLSGGERQRICIARVLLLKPSLLILDEPVTSLDASVRQEVLNLLLKLKQEFNLTYIFISHDLRLINFMSDRVLVMNAGSIIEEGLVSKVFENPIHEYTKALLHKN